MHNPAVQPEIRVAVPQWLDAAVDWDRTYPTDVERMALAVELARRNVLEESGGPFGAVIVDVTSGRLVSAGVNLVVRLRNSMLHAEIVACMLAEARLGQYSLGSATAGSCELVTSCEPCAMCLGAIHWAGVRRVVCGASGADARDLLFDEGPVFEASWTYLADRGVEVVRGVLRDEARVALDLYRTRNGFIYNGSTPNR